MGNLTYDIPQSISSSRATIIEEASRVAATHISHFESRTKFINGTQHYLKITDRTGMNVVLPPASRNGAPLTNTLEIDRFYDTSTALGAENSIVDPDGLRYDGKHSNIDSDRVIANALNIALHGTDGRLEDQWSYTGGKAKGQTNFLGVRYTLEFNEFHRNKCRALYLEELDYVVSLYDPHNNVNSEHPAMLQQGNSLPSDLSNVVSFGFCVEINDPHNQFGGRYLKVAERVVEVAPTKDPGKRPGVYITYRNDADCATRNEVTYYKFTDAAKLEFLYRYKEAAHTHGVDNSELKSVREHTKHKQDLEAMIRSEIIATLKHNRERDSLNEKISSERSSAVTKFFTDLPKWILPLCTAITTVGSLITIFKKKS